MLKMQIIKVNIWNLCDLFLCFCSCYYLHFLGHTHKRKPTRNANDYRLLAFFAAVACVPMCFSSHVQLDLSFQAINGPSKVCPGIRVAGLWWWWIADVSVRQSMAKLAPLVMGHCGVGFQTPTNPTRNGNCPSCLDLFSCAGDCLFASGEGTGFHLNFLHMFGDKLGVSIGAMNSNTLISRVGRYCVLMCFVDSAPGSC